jgi:gamma-glutamyltranspeptidase/glutathione hydrolase
MKRLIANCLTWALLLLVGASAASAATHPPLTTSKGAVAADNTLASQVGAEVLEKGGNAIDAAIATAFALGVVSPSASGIGGGGFAVIYVAKEKRLYAVDFREVGPAAVTPASYLRDGKVDPALSRHGGLAVGVPGEVAGLEFLSKRAGVLPWLDLVMPAQRLASRGFAVSWFFGWVAERVTAGFGPAHPLTRWLAPKGRTISEGRIVRRSALARTLNRIALEGSKGFYQGPVADDIVATVAGSGGLLTLTDLANYRVEERQPLVGQFRGYRVATFPLPSSGGLLLLEMLGILEAGQFDLASMGRRSSAAIHVVAEVLKHAFADRARFLGDDSSSAEIARTLLDSKRLSAIAKRIHDQKVGEHAKYGSPDLGASKAVPDDRGTSHLCAVDAEGNAVALTTTVNGYFGSGLVGKRNGVVLNNQMDDFSLASGVPNMFGLVQSDANLVGPGKRPLSSMTPTLVLDDEGVVGCFGGSGGPRIISGTLQVMLNVFVHGMNVRESVEEARVHHQWLPDALSLESSTASDVIEALTKRGHKTKPADYRTAVQAIVKSGDKLEAASDPRKGGMPAAPGRH